MSGTPKKRLVILCDGTWNKVQYKEGIRYATNVAKLEHMILKEDNSDSNNPIKQLVFYQEGVGTTGLGRIASAGTGVGVVNKVRDCYEYLVKNWVSGDEILIFGFSRGAYTARMLGAVIADIGILESNRLKEIDNLFEYFRDLSFLPIPTPVFEVLNQIGKSEVQPYQSGNIKSGIPLPVGTFKCIGVWDTVAAVGIPGFSKYTYDRHTMGYDVNILGPEVKFAFHALAMDETRVDFRPTLWHQPANQREDGQILKQVWFTGSHCDIGGGYHAYESDLSDVALVWMVANLIQHNLLAVNTREIMSLPKPAFSWGKMRPHDSTNGMMGMMKLLEQKKRKLPIKFDENTCQQFHESVKFRDDLRPELNLILKKETNLMAKLLPFENLIENSWTVVYHPKTMLDHLPSSIQSTIEAVPGTFSRLASNLTTYL